MQGSSMIIIVRNILDAIYFEVYKIMLLFHISASILLYFNIFYLFFSASITCQLYFCSYSLYHLHLEWHEILLSWTLSDKPLLNFSLSEFHSISSSVELVVIELNYVNLLLLKSITKLYLTGWDWLNGW